MVNFHLNPNTGGEAFREKDLREGGDGDVPAAAVRVLSDEGQSQPSHRVGLLAHRRRLPRPSAEVPLAYQLLRHR